MQVFYELAVLMIQLFDYYCCAVEQVQYNCFTDSPILQLQHKYCYLVHLFHLYIFFTGAAVLQGQMQLLHKSSIYTPLVQPFYIGAIVPLIECH